MKKNVELKLKGITNTKRLNKHGVKEIIESFKYVTKFNDATLTIKGRFEAMNLGLPVGDVGDTVLIEIGAKNTQEKLRADIAGKPRAKDPPMAPAKRG